MNIILAIITLLIMVTIHETGHYVAAVKSGLTVEEFSIGFGPLIYKKDIFEVRLVPLGGYDMIKELEDPDYEEEDITILAKISTIIWGPLSNIILGVILFVIMFMIGNVYYPAVVYVPQNSPSYKAGIRTGDKIVALNNHSIKQFTDITSYMMLNYSPPAAVSVSVERGGKILDFKVTPTITSDGRYIIGVALYYPPIVGDVLKDSPAYGKLQKGDRIISIDNKAVSSFNEIYEYIMQTATGDKMVYSLTISRNKATFQVDIEVIKQRDSYILGFVPESPAKIERYGLLSAVWKGILKTWDTTVLFFKGLWLMITGKISLKYVAGPVGIVAMMGEALSAKISLILKISSFLGMSALITIALGFTNLLPLPALDGGRLLFALLSLMGIRISRKVEEKIHMYGFYALLAILVLVTFKDIIAIIGGGF